MHDSTCAKARIFSDCLVFKFIPYCILGRIMESNFRVRVLGVTWISHCQIHASLCVTHSDCENVF